MNYLNKTSICFLKDIKKLKCLSENKKVIMVRMLLAEYYGNADSKVEFENIEEIRKTNRLLNELYDIVEGTQPWIESISVCGMSEYYTDSEFRYGCYPWHLNELAYSKIGKMIQEKYHG